MTISFTLPPETQKLLDDLREWSLREVRPLARTADTLQTKLLDGTQHVVESCPIDMSPLGVPELGLIRRESGERLRASDAAENTHVLGVLAMEAMNYGDGWAWGALPRNANLEKILNVIGTPEQLARWETRPGEEPVQSSFAFTEEHCGSDIAAIRTQAVRDGDEWVINGRKRFSSQGAEATVMLVFVTIDPSLGLKGLRGVMIPSDTPGITVVRETEDRKLGMRYLRQSTIDFHDVRVPYDCMLGDPDDPSGFLEGLNVLNRTRPFCMASNVGTLRGATDYVADWVKTQQSSFTARRRQRIEEDLAEIRASIDDVMRLLTYAAWKIDQGLPHRTEAAMAKSRGPVVIERAYRRLLQIMGSEGSSEQHLLEKWYRDAVCFDLVEGTSQILKQTASRGIFADADREMRAEVTAALQPVR